MIRDSAVSKVKLGKFFMNSPDFTELNIPELTRFNNTTINSLIINNGTLQTINLPALEQQPGIILGENVRNVNLSSLQYITNYSDVLNGGILTSKFLQLTKLQTLELPELQGTLSEENDLGSAVQIGFARNYWLKEVSLGNAYLVQDPSAFFGKFWFYYNFSLQKLILRYPYVIPLSNITGLATTPIGSRKGFIYVPDNLVEDYQTAGSWANFRDQFRPITELNNISAEDLAVLEEDTLKNYTWEEIINLCNSSNILPGDFQIGATKTIEIDGMPTQMVIVAKNRDVISGSNTTAKLTWIEKNISRYNPIYMSVPQGSIRNYSNIVNFHGSVEDNIVGEKDKILNGLPEVVRNGIKQVDKKTYGWLAVDGQSEMTFSEKIWIPSAAELNLGATAPVIETDSAYDYYVGTENIGNNVFKFGKTNRTSPSDSHNVALRTFTSSSNYSDSIDNNGRFVAGLNAQFSNYIIIGFCT